MSYMDQDTRSAKEKYPDKTLPGWLLRVRYEASEIEAINVRLGAAERRTVEIAKERLAELREEGRDQAIREMRNLRGPAHEKTVHEWVDAIALRWRVAWGFGAFEDFGSEEAAREFHADLKPELNPMEPFQIES